MDDKSIKLDKFSFESFYSEYTDKILDSIHDDQELKRFLRISGKSRTVLYDGTPIGLSHVSGVDWPEIQIAILKEYRNKGFGKALTLRIVDDLFKENCAGIKLYINKDNLVSMKSAEACGFHRFVEDEEFNPYNKEDMYYTYIRRNPNYQRRGR